MIVNDFLRILSIFQLIIQAFFTLLSKYFVRKVHNFNKIYRFNVVQLSIPIIKKNNVLQFVVISRNYLKVFAIIYH